MVRHSPFRAVSLENRKWRGRPTGPSSVPREGLALRRSQSRPVSLSHAPHLPTSLAHKSSHSHILLPRPLSLSLSLSLSARHLWNCTHNGRPDGRTDRWMQAHFLSPSFTICTASGVPPPFFPFAPSLSHSYHPLTPRPSPSSSCPSRRGGGCGVKTMKQRKSSTAACLSAKPLLPLSLFRSLALLYLSRS